ncbi:cytochrome P450 [Mycena epipterygia]|nr:cytochrome P450 [Mycena epipterygia]
MLESLNLLAALALLVLFFLRRLLHSRGRGAALPPGPRPLLGVLALPSGSDREWRTYGRWAEKWGEITSVTVFGQPVVVLNSFKAATEMLDKKSSVYSDRPVFQMCGELVGWNDGMALLSYGTPQFRRYRKYFHRLFGSHSNLSKFYPIEADESRKFLQRLLESPERFLSHIHQTASAIALRITYGYTVQGENDPIVSLVNSVMEEFSASVVPGAFLVDLIPILKYVPSWMPGAGFRRKAKAWASHLNEMIDKPFKLVEDQLAQGTAEDSFVSLLLQEGIPADELTDLKWAAGSIYGGGADTTVSVLSTFFLKMALNPEVQAKAQAELDAVVGLHRLPTINDREHLPYVDALCKEVFRYHPIGPMGLPHRAMEDDIHDGYFIPKGSLVLANIWNMVHDPAVYSKPMVFDPARFIASEHHTPEPDPRDIVFGFGRRVCPGKLLADATVFMACAMTLATFTISKTVKDGVPVEPVEDYQPGTISQPAPFLCDINPRSAEAVALIS